MTADEYDDLLAAVRWDYETARGIKDAVQTLAANQRAEEAAGRRAGERRAARTGRYGKWDIERELSSGGQANTFLVRDRTSTDGQRYVLKVLKNPKRLGRFADEVLAATRLDHPNIVRVVDSDLAAERPYLVTEHCEGGALDPGVRLGGDVPTSPAGSRRRSERLARAAEVVGVSERTARRRPRSPASRPSYRGRRRRRPGRIV